MEIIKEKFRARGDDGTDYYTSSCTFDTPDEVKEQIQQQHWDEFSSHIVITKCTMTVNGTIKLISEEIEEVIKGSPKVFKNMLQ